MFIAGEGGVGISCMYRLNCVVDNTEPWGTPFVGLSLGKKLWRI